MTRICAALFALTLVVAPAAAQFGYKPSESPFLDLTWKQSLGVFGGGLDAGHDAAGVGPQPGSLSGVRYDLRIGGPVSLVARAAAGPTWRRVVDPSKPPATRHVGDVNSTLMTLDLGLAANLTGQKSFHRIIPVVSAGVGMVSDFNPEPDLGGYRFGTRFAFNWGFGLRYHTKGRWEPRVDFTDYVWKLQFPNAYGTRPGDGSPAIVQKGRTTDWTGNYLWSLGLSYQLFR